MVWRWLVYVLFPLCLIFVDFVSSCLKALATYLDLAFDGTKKSHVGVLWIVVQMWCIR